MVETKPTQADLDMASRLSKILSETMYNKQVNYRQGDNKVPTVLRVSAFTIKERKKIMKRINELLDV